MSWNPHMEVHYTYTGCPYSTAGSFMEYFEGLTYEHVNFIFSGDSHAQESAYPTMNTNYYKFGLSEPGNTSYYDLGFGHAYELNDPDPRGGEQRRLLQSSSTTTNEQHVAVNSEWEGNANTSTRDNPIECPRRNQNSQDYQVIWQDNIDPDSMTYEELLELGEAVGTQSRGLSQDQISLLPISKYKCSFFSRKKSRDERCVICQMEYKRGDRRITLPCKHLYHAGCGTRWLSINKACPICYTEWLTWICGCNYGNIKHWEEADSRWDRVCHIPCEVPVCCFQTIQRRDLRSCCYYGEQDLANVDSEAEESESPVDEGSGDHEAGVEGVADDPAEEIPALGVKPVPEVVEALLGQVEGSAVIEIGIELVDHGL
ncbi:unnamed protein product [Prunus armeniaca]|uniref:RING-type domain-containing protein n=1 Tax=Prunus armeniaca TaxID=36596 RepID=A0A6J5USM2_PRUAR|nr:unnamed protein product [Prunus armeniaca]